MATKKVQKVVSKGTKSAGKATPVQPAVPQKETTMAKREKAQPPPEEQLGELMWLPVSQVDFTSFQNCRTGEWEKAQSTGDKEEGTTYEQLVKSIAEVGQKDPITVRRKPGRGNRVPYECIKGFRRGKAVQAVGEMRGEKDPQIKVIVKDLTDLEAHEENVFENTARDNLSTGDLAHAANNLLMRYQAAGMNMSVNALAKRMGKNQSYLNQLITIVAKAPDLAEKWRHETVRIPVDQMVQVAKLPANEQAAAYEQVKAGKALNKPNGKGAGRQPTAPDVKVANLGERMGNLFGRLETLGYISMKKGWSVELLKVLGGPTVFTDTTKEGQEKAVKAAIDAAVKAAKGIKENQKKAGIVKEAETEVSEEPADSEDWTEEAAAN